MTGEDVPAPRRVVVGPADDGRAIERVLARRLPTSADHAAKLLRQRRVRVGERALARGDRVARGDEVVVLPPPPAAARPPAPNRRLRLRAVHEDPDLLVIWKPPGLAMHPGPGHGTDTVLNALVGRHPELLALGPEREWGLVHRLDRDTSGLLLVARSAAAHEALVAAFAGRRVTKEYLALVAGGPPSDAGEVTDPVDGKEARTRYEVVERAPAAALVRAWPETGRMHQVRLHLAALGCPVLGDARHGGAGPRAPRLALHAHRLALDHPTTGAPLRLEAPLPRDLKRLWARLARGRGGPAPGRAGDRMDGERPGRGRGARRT
ncbi:MAG: RluA family pseudouridine synthase [Planctomycetes bacterium]|nr:RluA family pseudouridine synthase [Planctomycetota bacterium]